MAQKSEKITDNMLFLSTRNTNIPAYDVSKGHDLRYYTKDTFFFFKNILFGMIRLIANQSMRVCPAFLPAI
jgi:hypothetical protein